MGKNKKKRCRILFIMAVLCLILTGCGDSDGKGAEGFSNLLSGTGEDLTAPAGTAEARGQSAAAELSDFFIIASTACSGVGAIYTLWGFSEWGMAHQASDGGIQAQAIKKIAGGMLLTFGPDIIALIA